MCVSGGWLLTTSVNIQVKAQGNKPLDIPYLVSSIKEIVDSVRVDDQSVKVAVVRGSKC